MPALPSHDGAGVHAGPGADGSVAVEFRVCAVCGAVN